MPMVLFRVAAVAALWLPLAAMLTGCDAGPIDGKVQGRVAYRGNAVGAGIVNFYAPEKGVAAQADLDPSGAFAMPAAIPAGTYKVSVMPPIPEQLPPGSPIPALKPFVVPTKYQDAGLTPLALDVIAGENDFAIELED